MSEIYLNINTETLKKLESFGKEAAEETYGTDESKTSLLFENCEFVNPETSVDKETGEVGISGSFNCNGKELGYLNVDIRLDMDDVIALIECYMKRLGKLKTILEAVKG